jgi:mannosyltransferase
MTSPPQKFSLPSRRFAAMVVAETALAVVLSSWRIGSRSLWGDEAFSHAVARRASILAGWRQREPPHFGLYGAVLHVWEHIGSSEVVLRSLSAAFAVATVPVACAVARRLFDDRTAILAGLLMVFNAFFLYYAQEATMYTMALFACTLSAWCLLRAASTSRWGLWVAATGAAVLALYVHPVAALAVVSQAVALGIGEPALRWSRALPAAAVTAVCAIPLALKMHRANKGILGWIAPISWHQLWRSASALAGGSRLLLAVFVLLAAVALVQLARSGATQSSFVFTALWAFGPMTALAAISAVRSVGVARYAIGAFPALAILAAAGLVRLRPRPLAAAATAAVLVALSLSALQYFEDDYSPDGRQDWRAATAYVQARARPGDGVVFPYQFWRLGFEYYLDRSGPAGLVPLWPPAPWGSFVSGIPPAQRHAGVAVDSVTRIWVLFSNRAELDYQPAGRAVTSRMRRDSTQRFDGVTVALFVR